MLSCNTCQKTIDPDNEPYSIAYDNDYKISHHICNPCVRDEMMYKYQTSKEITTSLMAEACMAEMYLTGECDLDRLRASVVSFMERHEKALLEVARASKEIQEAERVFENSVWLPRLQKYYQNSDSRGHSGNGDGFRALLWGSAGRVLLTLQDLHGVDHPDSKFGGAHITLIFDETANYARGGIQSLCATKEEALKLVKAATENFPVLAPDSEVSVI